MTKFKLLTIIILCFFKNLKAQDFDISKWIQPLPENAIFQEQDYMVWCGSMVKGDDNKYYLFYSRWAKSKKHLAWVTDSEVAVAVSDAPTGPYKHVKVVLPKRAKKYWDADVTHNPTIHKFGKKYYLYYMGNYGNGEWWNHRNHQRIGVAVANSPTGKWKRCKKPLIDTTTNSFDHLMTANPSVTQRPDGTFLMVYKAVGDGKMPFGGRVLHGVAIAKKPEGPFMKQPKPVFVKDTVKFAAEDPYIWFQEGKYWAIVKDMKGVFTNAGTSLALFESLNGLDWQPAKNILVSTLKIPTNQGFKTVVKLERPQLYFENGKPKVLFCAVYESDTVNYNVAIPLKSF